MSLKKYNKDLLIEKDLYFYKKYNINKESIVVSYVGNIGFQSDFETILKAAAILEKRSKYNIYFCRNWTNAK